MRTNTELLQTKLEKVARILSDRYEISVHFSGESCYTDGRTIVLPSIPQLPLDATLERKDEHKAFTDAIEGYLDHEAAHIIWTDWNAVERVSGNLQAFTNLVEDIRIEARMQEVWKGTKTNLENASKYVVYRMGETWGKRTNLQKVLTVGSFLGKGHDDLLSSLGGSAGREITKMIEMMEPFKKALVKAKGLKSTYESVALARLLQKLLAEDFGEDLLDMEEEDFDDLTDFTDAEKEEMKKAFEDLLKDLAKDFPSPEDTDKEEKEEDSGESDEDGESGEEGMGGFGDGEESEESGEKGDSETSLGGSSVGKGDKEDKDSEEKEGKEGEEASGKGDKERLGDKGKEGAEGASSKDEVEDEEEGGASGDKDSTDETVDSETGEEETDSYKGKMKGANPKRRKGEEKESGGEGKGEGSTRGKEDAKDGFVGEDDKAKLSRLKDMFDASDREAEEAAKEMSDLLGDALSSEASKFKSAHALEPHYAPYTTQGDIFEVMPLGSRAWFKQATLEIQKSTGVLTRKLRRLLLAQKESRWSYEKEVGKINTKSLPKLLQHGHPRVFKRKTKNIEINTRISLLVDESGSMNGSKIKEARRCAILFGEFCHSLGIPFEILGFSTTQSMIDSKRFKDAMPKDQSYYGRFGDLYIRCYKEYKENWKQVGSRLEKMTAHIHNVDGESVEFAAKRLLWAAKEGERKILFVFSDGEPCQAIYAKNPIQEWHLKQVVKRVKEAGIEVVGFGIQTDSVKKYYPEYFVIDDPTKLSAVQVDKLGELLLNQRKKK